LNEVFENDIYTVELKDFSKNLLTEKIDILMSNKNNIKNKITESVENLCKNAEENADLFIKAMDYAENGETEED
jgi:hypothetical protein